MNKNSVVLLLSASFLTGSAFAGTMGPITQNSGLALNHFYTNGVLFNLTYLA